MWASCRIDSLAHLSPSPIGTIRRQVQVDAKNIAHLCHKICVTNENILSLVSLHFLNGLLANMPNLYPKEKHYLYYPALCLRGRYYLFLPSLFTINILETIVQNELWHKTWRESSEHCLPTKAISIEGERGYEWKSISQPKVFVTCLQRIVLWLSLSLEQLTSKHSLHLFTSFQLIL